MYIAPIAPSSERKSGVVDVVTVGEIDKSAVKKALKENNGVDLALFGRMVATDPDINCDASAQMAHAISTHRVENEYDFFTAVDDLGEDMHDHAGGGHLGTLENNDKASENLLLLDLLNAHREERSELRQIRAAKPERLARVALAMTFVAVAMSIALLIRIMLIA